jgi:hypothetical protein
MSGMHSGSCWYEKRPDTSSKEVDSEGAFCCLDAESERDKAERSMGSA